MFCPSVCLHAIDTLSSDLLMQLEQGDDGDGSATRPSRASTFEHDIEEQEAQELALALQLVRFMMQCLINLYFL
jgi:hypothetical protein